MNTKLLKDELPMANNQEKMLNTLKSTIKIQIKTTMKFHLT